MKKYISIVLFSLLVFSGCKKEDVKKDNEAEIQSYLTDNGLTAERTDEGLYYIITKEGKGEKANILSTVTVDYSGYLISGEVFDSSYDRGERSTFGLGNVIEGWQIGIPKLREGGAGKLIIPSHLAYGENSPNARIPDNAVLIFDIELHEVR